MTSKRILDRTRFSSDFNLEKFLPIYKNYAHHIHGNTLYQNMKYYHQLRLKSKLQVYSEDDFTPEYDYVAYENYTELGTWASAFTSEAQKRGPIIFSLIKQHFIFGVYKIPERNTIEEARNQILISIFDKILGLDSCVTFLAFINRIDSEHVSLEIFLFGVSDIDYLILEDILYSPLLVNLFYNRLAPQQSMYWFYKFHTFIYHNPSILSCTASLIALNVKSKGVYSKLFNRVTIDCESDGIFLSDFWGQVLSLFERGINDTFRDAMYSRYEEFSDFMQVGSNPENTIDSLFYVFQFTPSLTSRNRWWGINRNSPYKLTENQLKVWA